MSYAQRNQGILSRIDRHADHPSTSTLRKAAETCLTISERFAKERSEIERNNHLSADGKRAALFDSLRKTHARDLRDARKPFEDAEKNIKAMRESVKPAEFDRTDLVGAWERTEIRGYVASLSSGDKAKLLLEGADPRILDAVLSMPQEISGVPTEYYNRAKAAREEQLHGPLLREIDAAQEVLSEARNAAAIARSDLMNTIELDQREFDRIMLPIENKVAAPYLVRVGEAVLRVQPEKRGTAEFQKPASVEEIREGKFYESEAAYLQDRAA